MTTVRSYWKSQELVMVGVFAAAIKLSSLLIALAGGGMNPVSLLLKNLVFTTLLIVLLFTAVSLIVSVLLMGSSITLLPSQLAGALAAEVIILLAGGFRRPWAPFIGAAVYDFVGKAFSLGVSFLVMRETPALVISVIPIILIGYLGSLIGLYSGYKALQELRHAGIIRS